jgi:hypothetical protein
MSVCECTYVGTKDEFWQKMRDWINTTKIGGRYRITNQKWFTIERGRAFCSWSGYRIIMKADILEIEAEKHKVELKGFVMGTHPIIALCSGICGDFQKLRFLGTYSFDSDEWGDMGKLRSEGWKDMIALLDHLGIEDYQIKDLTRNSQNHGVIIQDN